ncbi:hypothetical protein HFO32_22095 [Rhizobium leguminosarum]|uniref:hypothetical protein n=1 Tax=Rhizobium leguminosarum TaxID=384 RepID=UPI001C966364|nr:hypothetical protein [Rhizobium leguminosarum]MBY5684817.1 hypothetical protein [Rhizobium leguminosarum]
MRRLIVMATALFTTTAWASPEDAKLSMIAFSAWECHVYANRAGDQAESERLFILGMETAKEFVVKLKAGEISKQDTFQHSPMAVMNLMQGPNNDFILGRFYELVASSSFEKITQKDSAGQQMEWKDWITDPATIRSIAETKFRQANCSMIKR